MVGTRVVGYIFLGGIRHVGLTQTGQTGLYAVLKCTRPRVFGDPVRSTNVLAYYVLRTTKNKNHVHVYVPSKTFNKANTHGHTRTRNLLSWSSQYDHKGCQTNFEQLVILLRSDSSVESHNEWHNE